MKKLGLILVFTFVALAGAWVWDIARFDQTPQTNIEQKQFANQSDDRGDVVVEVTPIVLKAGSKVQFKVVFNTHNVELDYDLLKLSTLSDDKGNSFKPLSWSGGSGGHHLNGELVFPSLSTKAKSAKLVIAGISGFDRSFVWNI